MRVQEVTGDQRNYREVTVSSKLRGIGQVLYGFAISPDGKYLATVIGGVSSGNVQVWSVEGGQMVVELSDESQLRPAFQGMKRVAFSAKGNYLAATGDNGCVWAISSHSIERPLTKNSFTQIETPAQYGDVDGIAPGPDDRYFAALSNDTIRIWKKRKRNARLSGFQEAARIPAIGRLMAFSPDGERLYVASRKTIQVWETFGPWEAMYMQHSKEIVTAVFSPEGNQVITISGDSARSPYSPYKYKVKRWSSDGPQVEREVFGFEIESWSLQSFTLTNDGRYLALRGIDNSVEIWDLSERPSVKRIPYPSEIRWVDSMTISPDGQYIALASSGHNKRTIVIYSLANTERFATLVVDMPSRDFELSVGGKYLATIDSTRKPVVWDVRTGRKITLQSIEHLPRIWRVGFSKKGKYLAVATRNDMYVLESGSWRVVSKIQHRDLLEGFSFSPDDRYLGTVNSFRSAQVWEAATGTPLASFDQVGQVKDLAFSPDGKYVVTTHDDAVGVGPFNFRRAHFVRLSLLQPVDLADELCKRLRMSLSDEKWKQYIGDHPICSRYD